MPENNDHGVTIARNADGTFVAHCRDGWTSEPVATLRELQALIYQHEAESNE